MYVLRKNADRRVTCNGCKDLFDRQYVHNGYCPKCHTPETVSLSSKR